MMISKALKREMNVMEMSIQELAEKADLPYETVRNLYYSKVKEPKLSTVLRIGKALRVSVDTLVEDEEIEERQLIDDYRRASARGKAFIKLLAEVESQITEKERKGEKHMIPLLTPVGAVRDGIRWQTCDVSETKTSDADVYLAIRITNNNFAPAYCAGDVIYLENRYPGNKERAVFMKEGRAYFRLFEELDGEYVLKCLNGIGVDFIFKRMDEVLCVGTVTGVDRSE